MRYNQKLRLGLGGEVRETTAVAMGLMLYWPMLRSPYFQNLFFASASTSFGGREAYAVANILIAGIAVIALAEHVVFCAARCGQRLRHSRFLSVSLAPIAAVLLLVSAQLTSSLAFAMKLAGIALFAVSFSAITFGWFSLLLASCRNWGFVVAVSFAASFASVGIEYLPNGAVRASLVVFPLATSLFLMIANRLAKQPKRNRVSAPYSPSIPGVDGIVLAATCFWPSSQACHYSPVRADFRVHAHVGNAENVHFLSARICRNGGGYETAQAVSGQTGHRFDYPECDSHCGLARPCLDR